MTKLREGTLHKLALMICGDKPYNHVFPYRKSYYLTLFFEDIGLDYKHDGSTRKWWVTEVLKQLNEKPEMGPGFPSSELRRVIEYLLSPEHYLDYDQDEAIDQVNRLLKYHNIGVEKDESSGNVTLYKISDGFISTATDEKKVRKSITFSPSVFEVPDKQVAESLVSVMMPFSMEFDSVLAVIKEACNEIELECKRVDDIWNNEIIIQDIFELIFCSSIVIADFTGRNPNVFYEVGIAHALGKIVVPITQRIEDVPFDLQHHRALQYLNNNEGLGKLRGKLIKRLSVLK